MEEYISNFPQKVYIPRDPECPQFPNIWWEKEPSDSDVEYIRTDVIVEKACEWLKENKDKYLYNTGEKGEYIPTCSNKIIDDFRRYIKGE